MVSPTTEPKIVFLFCSSSARSALANQCPETQCLEAGPTECKEELGSVGVAFASIRHCDEPAPGEFETSAELVRERAFIVDTVACRGPSVSHSPLSGSGAGVPPAPVPVGSPVWATKPGTTRWKMQPS